MLPPSSVSQNNLSNQQEVSICLFGWFSLRPLRLKQLCVTKFLTGYTASRLFIGTLERSWAPKFSFLVIGTCSRGRVRFVRSRDETVTIVRPQRDSQCAGGRYSRTSEYRFWKTSLCPNRPILLAPHRSSILHLYHRFLPDPSPLVIRNGSQCSLSTTRVT
jgi:hypothetical protein